ncbi:MAG: hypothetical protein JWR32_4858 [Mycobacterium sp.]|jgi:hypothetical protein|nr:hypothetical protein [Mycobacterium sp.]
MTPFLSPRASPVGHSDEYPLPDAAHMLGSLASADRREFDTHLSSGPTCSELSGSSSLPAQLTRDEVAGSSGQQPTPCGSNSSSSRHW